MFDLCSCSRGFIKTKRIISLIYQDSRVLTWNRKLGHLNESDDSGVEAHAQETPGRLIMLLPKTKSKIIS